MTVLAMETGRPDLPAIELRLSANVMPRAQLSPYAVYVTPSRKEPWETVLNVQYRADKPLKILGVHCDLETIQCELMPHSPPAEGAILGYYQIKVKLPPFEEIRLTVRRSSSRLTTPIRSSPSLKPRLNAAKAAGVRVATNHETRHGPHSRSQQGPAGTRK